jgi:hypothetical protein
MHWMDIGGKMQEKEKPSIIRRQRLVDRKAQAHSCTRKHVS